MFFNYLAHCFKNFACAYFRWKDKKRIYSKGKSISPSISFPNIVSYNDLETLNKIRVGAKTYGALNVIDFNHDSKLVIGSYCSIGPNVWFIMAGEHKTNTISTYPFKVKRFGYTAEADFKAPIIVEDDVWFGVNITICSGVHIGQGAIIAAGSTVTKDIPAYAIVGGNPAKVIRYRFSKDIIDQLIQVDITQVFDGFTKDMLADIYRPLENNSVILDYLRKFE